jgi:hypothetical protein
LDAVRRNEAAPSRADRAAPILGETMVNRPVGVWITAACRERWPVWKWATRAGEPNE